MTQRPEPVDLAAIARENAARKTRRDAAIPGPWQHGRFGGNVQALDGRLVANTMGHFNNQRDEDVRAENLANANFIRTARADCAVERIDALLDLVRQQRAALEKIIVWLERLSVQAAAQVGAAGERFPSFRDANLADAKNCQATANDLKRVVALTRDEKGPRP